MPRVRRLHLHLACASLATLGLLACRTTSSKIPLDKLTTEEPVSHKGEAREAVEPLPVERPTDLLPPEVAIMAEAINPAAVLAMIPALDKYPAVDEARIELSAELGGDITDAEQWDELGLDSHKPAGVGMLDIASESMFMYVSLADEAAFERTLSRVADMIGEAETMSSTELGDARIHRLNSHLSVVVREKIAMLVFVDEPEIAPRDYGVMVATIDPRDSLSHAERFSWARQQLESADDGMFYIEPSGLLRQLEQERKVSREFGLRRATEALAHARKTGAPPAEIREFERRLEEERRWVRDRAQRRAAEDEQLETLIAPIEAVVGAADLREDGIVAHGRLRIPAEALLRRLFIAPEHESPLLTALDEPPVVAFDGRIDLQVMLEFVDLMARADGTTIGSASAGLLKATGVDVLVDVFPALSGEGGFAITKRHEPNFQQLDKLGQSLGFAAHLGLRDPDAIRVVLDRIARSKLMTGRLVRAKRGGGWVLHMLGWHDVEIDIVGDRLIATTDPKLIRRVRNAQPGTQAKPLAAVEHPFRGPLVTPALRMYTRWSGLAVFEAREPWTPDAQSMLNDINTHGTLSAAEAAKVPHSREYKRKFKELEKIVAERNEITRRQSAREFEHLYAATTKLGDAGMQIEPLADGIGVEAQWRCSPGMTPFELGFTWYGLATTGGGDDWSEQQRLSNRAYAVAEELRNIRQADLDAAAAKRK